MNEASDSLKQDLSQSIIANFAWNIAGNGVVFLVTMLATPYILRRLSVDLYGVYTLLGVVVGYVALLRFGIGASSVKYLAEHIGNKDDVNIRQTFWFFQALRVIPCIAETVQIRRMHNRLQHR